MEKRPGPFAILTPAQMTDAAEDAAFAKATGRPLKSFLLGITAGGYIALGFVFFVTTQVGAEGMPWGVAKFLGGLVFSTGLALVVLTGAELFTGSTLNLTAKASGRITWAQLLGNWTVVYIANFVGALVIVALIYFGGTWRQVDGGWGMVVLETSLAKVQYSFVAAFTLGILCNLLVCLAIWAAYSGPHHHRQDPGPDPADRVVRGHRLRTLGGQHVHAAAGPVDQGHRRCRILEFHRARRVRLRVPDVAQLPDRQPATGHSGQHRRRWADGRHHVLDHLPLPRQAVRGLAIHPPASGREQSQNRTVCRETVRVHVCSRGLTG